MSEKMKITTTEVVESECTGARIVQVIETKFARGSDEVDNPVRMVRQYWSVEGELLAEAEETATARRSLTEQYRAALNRLKFLQRHMEQAGIDVSGICGDPEPEAETSARNHGGSREHL